MAQESCNLDKEETEILKPSSSSSPSSPSPSPSPAHKEETAEKMKPLSSSTPPKSSSSSSSSSHPPLFANSVQGSSAKKLEKLEESKPLSRSVNRCSNCQKKVGLTGFRCRCGRLFCGQHRYSDVHDCSFDYKALAREQISKENPVIRPAKIIKI
ncbi:uncharacterized protein A4U43_C04F19350 [Asparagus officinalis]|uniref:AN1-type domain-containing protein n=1 Tax=Asparagus officinalis TaxID=4686 RepID=A0A5P1F7F5_ASPOF|nr:zinc finger AN1 domain-containing stress-associated protein 15-like [Asparagus officinalis]ONK72430.1 uncharacterized protein A4U43_C04F19350 [Asparagus officinalis]